ncbi:MAG: FixH family protein [Caldimicrobium sp.]|nr:FixH family protein [Caldimicrobium sp.]MCX7613218.1 FixH family protein [Caldimicrobium sp.]MDW8182480.1 FixH family protein [Caldimicrobium sp.]
MIRGLVYLVIFIGLSAIAFSIYIGKKNFDGKIYEKSYELGISYDKYKKAEKFYNLTLSSPTFKVGENDLIFKINEDAMNQYRVNRIKVRVSWIANNEYDLEYEATPKEGSNFLTKIKIPFSGKWNLIFFLPYEGEVFPLFKRIEVDYR